jgi:hypothetical protein
MRSFLFLLIFFLIAHISAVAQVITGRLVTSAYTWERQDYSNTKFSQLRAMETIQLDIGEKDFALKTYFQGSNDFGTSITDDPRLKFYNLYLEKKNLFDLADVKFGRVPVYLGMGVGSIDGAFIKVRPMENKLILSACIGRTIPADQSLKMPGNFSDNMMLGFQALSYIIPDASIALSFMDRHWKPQTVESFRFDTAYNLVKYTFDYDSESERYGSLDFFYSKEFININGKLDYDFNINRLYRGEASVRYNLTQNLGISAEFSHKKPRTIYNSIFAVFSQEATNEFGGGIDYLIDHKYNVFARFSEVQYTDENDSRLDAGVNCNYGSITYSRNFGFIGDLDNLSVQGIYPLMNRKIILNGGINYSSYKLESEDKASATAFVLGGSFRASSSVSFDLQGQMMVNDVYKNDLRFYFRFTYRFLSKSNIF